MFLKSWNESLNIGNSAPLLTQNGHITNDGMSGSDDHAAAEVEGEMLFDL